MVTTTSTYPEEYLAASILIMEYRHRLLALASALRWSVNRRSTGSGRHFSTTLAVPVPLTVYAPHGTKQEGLFAVFPPTRARVPLRAIV